MWGDLDLQGQEWRLPSLCPWEHSRRQDEEGDLQPENELFEAANKLIKLIAE